MKTKHLYNICTIIQHNVEDVGPTLYKYYTNVLCLLGYIRKYSINYHVQLLIIIIVQQITIKEEDRLAATIAEIEEEVRIVPRGAYIRTPTGQVYQNRSFEGMLCF